MAQAQINAPTPGAQRFELGKIQLTPPMVGLLATLLLSGQGHSVISIKAAECESASTVRTALCAMGITGSKISSASLTNIGVVYDEFVKVGADTSDIDEVECSTIAFSSQHCLQIPRMMQQCVETVELRLEILGVNVLPDQGGCTLEADERGLGKRRSCRTERPRQLKNCTALFFGVAGTDDLSFAGRKSEQRSCEVTLVECARIPREMLILQVSVSLTPCDSHALLRRYLVKQVILQVMAKKTTGTCDEYEFQHVFN
ncbi:hypothetical protein GGS21DRAFT_491587 [Xylaria nigripes]|nr:hypothetical protein GGS21DRAFT_491587 [Xylaria nigripes]